MKLTRNDLIEILNRTLHDLNMFEQQKVSSDTLFVIKKIGRDIRREFKLKCKEENWTDGVKCECIDCKVCKCPMHIDTIREGK